MLPYAQPARRPRLGSRLVQVQPCDRAEQHPIPHGQDPRGRTDGFVIGVQAKAKHLLPAHDGFRARDLHPRTVRLGFLPPSATPECLT
jgi:hypothetical protein